MCGIIGSVNIEWKSDPLDSISHRGPDFRNEFSNEFIYLGHSRLSILDTSSLGNQPMISKDSNWVLIYNGEIYNHKDIREDLKKNFKETFISCRYVGAHAAIVGLNASFIIAPSAPKL